ncbi:hypothetical protein P8452_52769 [Trifolium repens]|nr:hypothetical protein P8452_52769 [Trifolium repens]
MKREKTLEYGAAKKAGPGGIDPPAYLAVVHEYLAAEEYSLFSASTECSQWLMVAVYIAMICVDCGQKPRASTVHAVMIFCKVSR